MSPAADGAALSDGQSSLSAPQLRAAVDAWAATEGGGE